MTATQTATVEASNFLGRSIGRCRKCKTVLNRKTFLPGSRITCNCGAKVDLKGMFGRVSVKECDSRCTGAVGPACDCKCGGENHGGAHSLVAA